MSKRLNLSASKGFLKKLVAATLVFATILPVNITSGVFDRYDNHLVMDDFFLEGDSVFIDDFNLIQELILESENRQLHFIENLYPSTNRLEGLHSSNASETLDRLGWEYVSAPQTPPEPEVCDLTLAGFIIPPSEMIATDGLAIIPIDQTSDFYRELFAGNDLSQAVFNETIIDESLIQPTPTPEFSYNALRESDLSLLVSIPTEFELSLMPPTPTPEMALFAGDISALYPRRIIDFDSNNFQPLSAGASITNLRIATNSITFFANFPRPGQMQNRVNHFNFSTGQWNQLHGDFAPNRDYSIFGLQPGTRHTLDLQFFCPNLGRWTNYQRIVTTTAVAPRQASITNIRATTNAITFDAVFPIEQSQNRINILDLSTGQWRNHIDSSATSSTHTISGLRPGTRYRLDLQFFCHTLGRWTNYQTEWTTTPVAPRQPSITIVSTTSTSIMFDMVFPTEQHNNRLNSLDLSTGIWRNHIDHSAQSSRRELYNLRPNTTYRLDLQFFCHTLGRWTNFQFEWRTLSVPETWTTHQTTNLTFRFEPGDISQIPTAVYTQWRSNMQTTYQQMRAFVGGVPFNGERITIQSSRTQAGNHWGVAGNPIFINQRWVPLMLHDIQTYGTWCFGTMHELGHNFTSYRYNFHCEFWANFLLYFVVEQRNATVRIGGRNYRGGRGANGLSEYFRSHATHSFNNTISRGNFHHDGMLFSFIRIQEQIGWNPFIQTIEHFNNMPASAVPSTDLGKLNLFLTLLRDYSGRDVIGMMQPFERTVYGNHFGGQIQYVSIPDGRTRIVLLPGIKGSRLYTLHVGNSLIQLWEPNAFTLVLLESELSKNEDGESRPLIFPFRMDGDYGATDVYQSIYRFLNDNNHFPHSEFDVLFFTYDWRLSSARNAYLLERELNRLYAQDGIYNTIFVAHSMGGIVASSFLARSQANRDRVEMLITFGTPFLGATKAIDALETGRILTPDKFLQRWLIEPFILRPIMQRLAANTVSVYELLPTSRYGNFITTNFVGPVSPPPHTIINQRSWGREFVPNRPWAIRENGTVKPMFDASTDFHNNLMVGGEHIANTVTSFYFVGTGSRTQTMAYFNTFDMGHTSRNHTWLAGFSTDDGDGTVTVRSQSNGLPLSDPRVIQLPNRGHVDMLDSPIARLNLISLIRTGQRLGANTLQEMGLLCEFDNQLNDISNYISVILQGVENVDIYDSRGNQIIQRGMRLYRQVANGAYERIGEVILINYEMQRFQYMLDSDEYIFRNIAFNESISPEVVVMSFENWLYTSHNRYLDFCNRGVMELSVSNNTLQLLSSMERSIIQPIHTASFEELQNMNYNKNIQVY